MNDRPGTIPPPAQQQHPRRPPAHKSVSLRHSPAASGRSSKPQILHQTTTQSSPNVASDTANPPSILSPKLPLNKQSSGESSDAGKWFETTNNNAKQSEDAYANNDPPFFLRNSSSADTPPDVAPTYGQLHSGIPYRGPVNPLSTDASSTDDFRSVIDDLTVANKKLRQKLKKYETMYDAHLQEEKLFEVRFHGLPDHKKKELEETLRKFAAELDDDMTNPSQQIVSTAPGLEKQQTASSGSRFAESGYVSMSASGPNSSARSALTTNQGKDRRRMTKSQYSRQQQDIHTYLHDIPSGLLPRNKAPMTDKSKKKLIVRRLEQIFAGKRSAAGPHQQPLQQEEVAQSAATADRQERAATGRATRPEGLREAHIMSREPNGHLMVDVEAVPESNPQHYIREQSFAASGTSPDQRPTRPLDLDPSRAQVSAENMDYIRHLGFTPPDMASGEAPIQGHGWLYLNLLINMAQLHIYNVTPEYVKDAIQDYSSYLEISRDGRKVRWMGGRTITNNSGDNSSEHHSGTSPDLVLDFGSPQKQSSVNNTGESSVTPNESEKRARMMAHAKRQSEQKKFAYKPIFFRKEDSDDEEDFYGASPDDSLPHQQLAGDSSGIGSSAMQSHSSKPRRENGPMIFYTKAKFCTDLSGDRLGASATNAGSHKIITNQTLGGASERRPTLFRASSIAEPRGPMDGSPMDVDSNAGSGNLSSVSGFGFSPEDLARQSGNDSPDITDFEVSGLGGVHPDDNFSIHVQRSQMPAPPSKTSGRRKSHHYPQKIRDALIEQQSNNVAKPVSPRNPRKIIKEEVISATRKSLPQSILPPASFLPFDSTSSGDVDSDLESDASSEIESDSAEVGTTAIGLLNMGLISANGAAADDDDDENSEMSFDCSDDSDDGSIDLLATARRLDPSTVLASEREYDAAFADRLAEELPTGSSAATAGGGSGFNSPEFRRDAATAAAAAAAAAATVAMFNQDSNTPNAKRLSVTSSTSSRSNLKRAHTSDSLPLTQKAGSKGTKSRKMTNLN